MMRMPQKRPEIGSRMRSIISVLREYPLLSLGIMVLSLMVVGAIFAPWITPYPGDSGIATNVSQALLSPNSQHWFGTDQIGRDIFTRTIYGARISLSIAAFVILTSACIGLTLGLVAGFFGGWLDSLIMRITDVFLAFPALLLAVSLTAVLSPSATNAALALALTWWPWYARLSRGEATTIRKAGFADAARVIGAGKVRILTRHVFPNAASAVFVQMSLDGAGIILTASTLSYLGLGAQDPTAEWGLMVSQGQSLATTAWWVVAFPGMAILLTAVAFNFLGDGLQNILDPKRRSQ